MKFLAGLLTAFLAYDVANANWGFAVTEAVLLLIAGFLVFTDWRTEAVS